ncbi:MAG: hypothetical protein ACRCZS_19550 [Chroococcidiopsis sp.]
MKLKLELDSACQALVGYFNRSRCSANVYMTWDGMAIAAETGGNNCSKYLWEEISIPNWLR